jgi:hypothetical protein
MVRDSMIRHVGSASIGGKASPLNVYFQTRNGLLFAERHIPRTQRIEFWRTQYRRARELVGGRGRLRWLPLFFLSRDRLVIAFRRAIRDYLLRRFGDCPPFIRQLNRAG